MVGHYVPFSWGISHSFAKPLDPSPFKKWCSQTQIIFQVCNVLVLNTSSTCSCSRFNSSIFMQSSVLSMLPYNVPIMNLYGKKYHILLIWVLRYTTHRRRYFCNLYNNCFTVMIITSNFVIGLWSASFILLLHVLYNFSSRLSFSSSLFITFSLQTNDALTLNTLTS